jgi:hypothetical protein
VRLGDEVRRHEDEQGGDEDEGRPARDPPPVAQQAREPHHDQNGQRQEHELGAEHEPAAEDDVDVAHLRDVVSAVPPVACQGERQLDEPDDAEAEHGQEGAGADPSGRRLAHEGSAANGVDAKHRHQGDGRSAQLTRWKSS